MSILTSAVSAFISSGLPKKIAWPTPISRPTKNAASDRIPRLDVTSGQYFTVGASVIQKDIADATITTLAATDFNAGLGGAATLLASCIDYETSRIYGVARFGTAYGIGYRPFTSGAFVFRSSQTPAFSVTPTTGFNLLRKNGGGTFTFYTTATATVQKTVITESTGVMTAGASILQGGFAPGWASPQEYFAYVTADEKIFCTFSSSGLSTAFPIAIILWRNGGNGAISYSFTQDDADMYIGAKTTCTMNGDTVSLVTTAQSYISARHFLRSDFDAFLSRCADAAGCP